MHARRSIAGKLWNADDTLAWKVVADKLQVISAIYPAGTLVQHAFCGLPVRLDLAGNMHARVWDQRQSRGYRLSTR